MSAVSYRNATVADASELWRVRTASIVGLCSEHYPGETIRAWASVPLPVAFVELIKKGPVVVAQLAHQLIGYGFLDAARGRVEGMFVKPEHARCGIGAALLTRLESFTRDAKLERLTLDSTLNAAPFYTSQGYERLASGTWSHPSGFDIDCVHMVKDL